MPREIADEVYNAANMSDEELDAPIPEEGQEEEHLDNQAEVDANLKTESQEDVTPETPEEDENPLQTTIKLLHDKIKSLEGRIENQQETLRKNGTQLKKHRLNIGEMQKQLSDRKAEIQERIQQAEEIGDQKGLVDAELDRRALEQEEEDLQSAAYVQQEKDKYLPAIEKIQYPELEQDMGEVLQMVGATPEQAKQIMQNPWVNLPGQSVAMLAQFARLSRSYAQKLNELQGAGSPQKQSVKSTPQVTKRSVKASAKQDPFSGVSSAPKKKSSAANLMTAAEAAKLSDEQLDALYNEDLAQR